MKSLFIFLLIGFTSYHAFAQVKAFSPLSCFTWGPDQFLDFETVQRNALPDLLGPYNYTLNPSPSSYESFGKNRGVYSWLPDTDRFQYINNVQVIRWNFVDTQTPYEITVKNIFDEALYSTSTENSCGVIIFPDSINTIDNIILIHIKANTDQYERGDQLKMINFSHVELRPRNKAERLATLKELQSCSSIACKIEKLKADHATLDILSLLELEKMKDPKNKDIDKLYWEIVSQIRYEFSNRAWER
jgi:hypothetical protein